MTNLFVITDLITKLSAAILYQMLGIIPELLVFAGGRVVKCIERQRCYLKPCYLYRAGKMRVPKDVLYVCICY